MRCSGCLRELRVGDRYVIDAPDAFTHADASLDDVSSGPVGGGKVLWCEDCVESGGEHLFETLSEEE